MTPNSKPPNPQPAPIDLTALSNAVQQIMASANTADLTPGASLTRKLRSVAVAEQILEVWLEHAVELARTQQLNMREFDRATRVLSRLAAIQQSLHKLQLTIKINPTNDPDDDDPDSNSGPNSNPNSEFNDPESQTQAESQAQAAAAQLDAEIAEALAEAIDLQTIAHNKSRAANFQNPGNSRVPGAPSIASIINNDDLPVPMRMMLAMEQFEAAQARAEQVMSQPAPSQPAHFQNYSSSANFNSFQDAPDDTQDDLDGPQYLANPIRAARDPWYNGSAITRQQNNEKRRAAGDPPPERKLPNTSQPFNATGQLSALRAPRAYAPPRLNSYPLYNLDAAINLTSKDLTYLTKVKNPLTPPPPPEPNTLKTILNDINTYRTHLNFDSQFDFPLDPNSPIANKPTPQSHSPDP